MKRLSRTSSSADSTIVCPACERGELEACSETSAECSRCGRGFEGGMLLTLHQIVALPDALGRHACDCGHPEMRLLPDGVYWCPACGSEVLPPAGGGGSVADPTSPWRRPDAA